MRTSRFIGIGFLVLCALIVLAVAQGWLSSSAPLAIFPTAVPAPTNTPNPADVVTVELIYSTEKEQWLKEAVAAWQATGPTVDGRPIQVRLVGAGSQEIVAGLADGSLRPTAISPASSLQIRQINAVTIEGQQNIAADAQPLVYTPLVVVGWKPAAAADQSPMGSLEQGQAALWRTLQQQVVAHAADRTFLFGQTAPDSSNSGLATLVLMAYAYHNKTSGLTVADIQDAGFQRWLTDYVRNVERFGESTGTFMQDMIRFGPSRYTALVSYEATALEYLSSAKNRWGELELIYPPANLWSDHPLAILSAPWVTQQQRDAAQQLRAFLLTTPQQQAAVTFGFRPTDPSVALDGADSPFQQYASYGVKPSINQLVEDPSAEVVNALMDLWMQLKPLVRQ